MFSVEERRSNVLILKVVHVSSSNFRVGEACIGGCELGKPVDDGGQVGNYERSDALTRSLSDVNARNSESITITDRC